MECFYGAIQLFPYTYTPQGWAECLGQTLSVQQYSALFSLIGTKFGGDGRSTFKLPNLKAASPVPNYSRYCICIEGAYYPQRP